MNTISILIVLSPTPSDINTRIDELLRELAKIGASATDGAADAKLVPWFSPLEDLEESLLTVKDSEVKVGMRVQAWCYHESLTAKHQHVLQ